MLTIYTRDGLATKVDLQDETAAREWLEHLSDPVFQGEITGLTVGHKGVQYSLPRPSGFGSVRYEAESLAPEPSKGLRGGERVQCFADGVRVSLMVHEAHRAVRVSLSKVGKRRYDPFAG